VTGFDEFFATATGGFTPYGHQRRMAFEGLPDVVEAPTGTGKTEIILAWLWRRFHGAPGDTPRRLIFALPQRSLVEQAAARVESWLTNLGPVYAGATLHVIMGGTGRDTQHDWRKAMGEQTIVIGTVDSLVSKALNRGYGIGRAMFPVDFALATNGAHWVVDETQQCPESVTTLRQIAAFARRYGTAESFGLTCMSATIDEKLLATVDNPQISSRIRIEDEDRTGSLNTRLDAKRTIRHLITVTPGDYAAIATAARERHRPGHLTLVVLNTVEAARAVYKQLNGTTSTPCTLIHSRFRPHERQTLMDAVIKSPANRIVVSTQVIEAGIDLDAATMITEAAPWPSIVQRAGRCNRTGTIGGADLWWVSAADPAPYPDTDIDATCAALAGLEGRAMTGEGLLAQQVDVTRQQVAVLRRPDFIALFDTAPDLNGNDIDVAPYVRDTDDLDAQLAWATWAETDKDPRPPADSKVPPAEFRCRVPVNKVNELAKNILVWHFDQALAKWTRVTRARPGEVVVINAADGRYDLETGFDPSAKKPVPDCPELVTKDDPATGTEDAYGADSSNVGQANWLDLDRHSDDVRGDAISLIERIKPELPPGTVDSVVLAAYLHDVGKAHEIWQRAIRNLAPPDDAVHRDAEKPWAKSGLRGRPYFDGGVAFRHELASLLMLDGPMNDMIAGLAEPDLVKYLVLAHHGKLRMQVRDLADLGSDAADGSDSKAILGLKDGATSRIPEVLGHSPTELNVDLSQFRLGDERSWTRRTSALLAKYGPFTLAYMEALVRVADWRASQREEQELAHKA
jgi:CRISPR-associated endonuclease/helicase Cas3